MLEAGSAAGTGEVMENLGSFGFGLICGVLIAIIAIHRYVKMGEETRAALGFSAGKVGRSRAKARVSH